MQMKEGEVANFWMTRHPVVDALCARRNRIGVSGSAVHDGLRIGLAVEGGGMRGIVSAAMLAAIEDRGFAECFDGIYGFSAGAVNAAYFLAGNYRARLPVYYHDLPASSLFDFRRLVRGKSFLDIDALFDKFISLKRPLDYDAIENSRAELHIGITDVDALRTEDVSKFHSRADLIESLRASSWMPISSFHTALWRGKRAMDGSVLTGHPTRLAILDGCSHVLSLSTRPIRPVGFHGSRVAQFLGALHLERMKRRLGFLYYQAADEYWLDRSAMHGERLDPTSFPQILDLAPLPYMLQLSYHELDSGRLIRAAAEAYEIAYAVLDHGAPGSPGRSSRASGMGVPRSAADAQP